MRRLLLLLFALLLATPAVASPHCAPAPVVATSHEGGHHERKHSPDDDLSVIHGCIGCAAPCRATLAPPAMIAIEQPPAAQPVARLAGHALYPEPPPPRRLG